MTYHMEQVPLKKSPAGEVEHRITFPHKLWDAVNEDSGLLKWSMSNNSFLVNEDRFEKLVMRTHPGLVQIPTFTNFRRQLRWYCFDWNCLNDLGDFEFSHPSFEKGNPELLDGVLTRRRAHRFPRKIKSSRICDSPCDKLVDGGGDFSPIGRRGGPGCRMTLRTRAPQRTTSSDTLIPQHRRRRRRTTPGCLVSRKVERPTAHRLHQEFGQEMDNSELWWYYCAIFGQPEHTFVTGLNNAESKNEATYSVDIPVCFHEDPAPLEVFDRAVEVSGDWGMDGRMLIHPVQQTPKLWECSDLRTYTRL